MSATRNYTSEEIAEAVELPLLKLRGDTPPIEWMPRFGTVVAPNSQPVGQPSRVAADSGAVKVNPIAFNSDHADPMPAALRDRAEHRDSGAGA